MESLRAASPDVSLVDLAMPGSLPLVRAMRADRPEVQVVTLSVPEAEQEVLACAEAGAAGFVTLDSSLDDLCAILLSVGRGDVLCPPWIAGALLRHVATLARGGGGTLGTDLTTREREVMELVDRGLSNKEIGRLLHIELPTVKNHVHSILRKLHVSRRSEAITRFRGVMVSARDDATQRADV
jgi:two-component system nitrate/nitrite response regulator NarL